MADVKKINVKGTVYDIKDEKSRILSSYKVLPVAGAIRSTDSDQFLDTAVSGAASGQIYFVQTLNQSGELVQKGQGFYYREPGEATDSEGNAVNIFHSVWTGGTAPSSVAYTEGNQDWALYLVDGVLNRLVEGLFVPLLGGSEGGTLGEGVTISKDGSNRYIMGNEAIVSPNAELGYDCKLGDYVEVDQVDGGIHMSYDGEKKVLLGGVENANVVIGATGDFTEHQSDVIIGTGVRIDPAVVIEEATHIYDSVHIGARAEIGADVLLHEGLTIKRGQMSEVVINDLVTLGTNLTIGGGLNIQRGSGHFAFSIYNGGVNEKVTLYDGVAIEAYAFIGENASIGTNVSLSSNTSEGGYIFGNGARLGDNVSIGMNVAIFGTTAGGNEALFIGTNDARPILFRATDRLRIEQDGAQFNFSHYENDIDLTIVSSGVGRNTINLNNETLTFGMYGNTNEQITIKKLDAAEQTHVTLALGTGALEVGNLSLNCDGDNFTVTNNVTGKYVTIPLSNSTIGASMSGETLSV